AEEGQLEAEMLSAVAVEVAGVIPPLGRVLRVRPMVAREGERARRGGASEAGQVRAGSRLYRRKPRLRLGILGLVEAGAAADQQGQEEGDIFLHSYLPEMRDRR